MFYALKQPWAKASLSLGALPKWQNLVKNIYIMTLFYAANGKFGCSMYQYFAFTGLHEFAI